MRAYADVNDTEDLLSPVARESAVPAHEAVDACWATFDELDQEVARETLQRIYITVSDWYTTLVSRREAALNPTDGDVCPSTPPSRGAGPRLPLQAWWTVARRAIAARADTPTWTPGRPSPIGWPTSTHTAATKLDHSGWQPHAQDSDEPPSAE